MVTDVGDVRGTQTPVEALATVAPVRRISWGAIFAGAVASLAIWMLLYSLGLALGLSTVDPNNPGSLRSSGMFTGVWSVIAPLIALFLGGMVAGHAAGALDRTAAGIHGLVMWGLTTLTGVYLVVNLVGSVLGGVASLGRSAVEAGGGAIASVAQRAQGMGIDADAVLAPVNQRLQAEGRPPVTAAQLQAATRDVVQDAIRTGRLDRQQLVGALSERTALSPGDAEELATRIEGQVQQVRGRVGQAAEAAQTGALQAAEATGKAFWGVFFAMLLGAVAAIGGALVGVGRRHRRWERARVEGDRTVPVLRERPTEG